MPHPIHRSRSLRAAATVVSCTLGACSSLNEAWQGPGGESFRPSSIAVLPPDVGEYEGAREAVQEVLIEALLASERFERVLGMDQVHAALNANDSTLAALVRLRQRLDVSGATDAAAAKELAAALGVDALLLARVNGWEYTSRDGDNLARVSLGLRLLDPNRGVLVWRGSDDDSDSYMFLRPELRDIATDVAHDLVAGMPGD
jgi:hypothetical protein